MLGNGDELKEEIIIDEEEAKKQFLEELRNMNNEEAATLDKDDNLKDDKELKENDNLEDKNDIINESIVEPEIISEDNENSLTEGKNIKSILVQKVFKATLIDTIVAALISVIGVYLFDFILRLFGYYVVDFKGVYIIALLLILILYPTIMQSLKYGKTFGQKYSKTQV